MPPKRRSPGDCPTPRLKKYASEAAAPAKAHQCACGHWHLKPRRPRGDGALYKRADGLWVGRVELPMGGDGKRRFRTVSSMDRGECLKKLKKLRTEVDAGQIAVTSTTTTEKWLDRWLNEIHKRKIRPGTYAGYERIIRLHINPHIGTKKLDKLTATHIRQMHDNIDKSRNAQLAHVILQKALTDAQREGMITRNVALLVDKPGHITAERDPLTAEQAAQLLKSTQNDPLYSRWVAALLLGARQGELLGLQWSRVDLTNGVVDFSWQLQQLSMSHGCGKRNSDKTYPCGYTRATSCPQKKWDFPRGFEHQILHGSLVLTRPKTKKGSRIIPIPGPLWTLLEQLPHDGPHDLVWHHDGKPIDRYTDYGNWQTALNNAGLPAAPLHVARHTVANLLMLAGVSEEIRMAVLGHAGIKVTRGYSHAKGALELQRGAMDGALKELLAKDE